MINYVHSSICIWSSLVGWLGSLAFESSKILGESIWWPLPEQVHDNRQGSGLHWSDEVWAGERGRRERGEGGGFGRLISVKRYPHDFPYHCLVSEYPCKDMNLDRSVYKRWQWWEGAPGTNRCGCKRLYSVNIINSFRGIRHSSFVTTERDAIWNMFHPHPVSFMCLCKLFHLRKYTIRLWCFPNLEGWTCLLKWP